MSARLFPIEDTTTSDDWYTPPWIFDGLGIEFDLDVCSPIGGLGWIPAQRHYSESDDGLLSPWDGLVWCNPPYSAPFLWCCKWAQHEPGGLILIRADLSCAGPNVAFGAADAIYFPVPRIEFVGGHGGKAPTRSPFSSVVMAKGQASKEALHRLAASHGGVCRTMT